MPKQSKSPDLPDNPVPVIVTGVIIILITFVGLGGWAAMTKVSAAVIASGVVKVDTNRKTVQHLEGGIVNEILVREGDRVAKGQILIRLEAEEVIATFDLMRGQRDHLLAVRARLEAERDLSREIAWPKELLRNASESKTKEILESENKIFISRRTALESQITLHEIQIDQLELLVKSLQEQSLAVERIIASLREELGIKTQLMEGRFLEKSHIMEMSRSLDGNLARKSQLIGEIAQTRERIAELRLRIQESKNRYLQDAVTELGSVQTALFDLEERQRPSVDRARRLEIASPEDGVVVDLRVHTTGGVVGPREPLMDIVPGEYPLIVEAPVAVDQISQVHTGLSAELMLSAFKRRTTPRAQGIVVYVSPDRLIGEPPLNFPHYVIHIELDQDSVEKAIGDATFLTAGMPVEVFIKTRARNIIEYMIEPLTSALRRGLTEE